MQKNTRLTLFGFAVLILLSACNSDDDPITQFQQQAYVSKAKLGKMLFNDESLSRDGNQSCASCHNPDHAFIDDRENETSVDNSTPGAVSTGQDDSALGDRNAPTATYAAFIPIFHFDESEDDGLFKGGQFLDGREKDLQGQAGGPFLNPVEMQTSKSAVVDKVQNKYYDEMVSNYGESVFDSVETAYDAITDSISRFEKTDAFASFDSKFDKYLQGEVALNEQEAEGLEVFKAEDKGNCAACHTLPTSTSSRQNSVFTDFTYDNLGVPKNELVRELNGKGADFVDNGLYDNPNVDDPDLKGAFRVSTLRNIAVTAPYMHNGVFKDLKTVIHFYNTRDVDGAINPETGEPWQEAEVDATKNTEELGDLGLSDEEEDALVAFLKTLTDSRYQHLIP